MLFAPQVFQDSKTAGLGVKNKQDGPVKLQSTQDFVLSDVQSNASTTVCHSLEVTHTQRNPDVPNVTRSWRFSILA